AEAGFYPPERLTPHITIARLKGKRLRANERKRILSSIVDVDIKPIKPFLVESLNVYESVHDPRSNKSRYHLLYEVKLGLKSFPLGP
ncbi:MAG: hypothetical protein HY377_01905, partial [Candidatus Blackburnbacteria bacterium]|nr:hypothetical protein [Candidatus Blackburnbacteria bacterium]